MEWIQNNGVSQLFLRVTCLLMKCPNRSYSSIVSSFENQGFACWGSSGKLICSEIVDSSLVAARRFQGGGGVASGIEMNNHLWVLFLRAKGNGSYVSLHPPSCPISLPPPQNSLNEDGWAPFPQRAEGMPFIYSENGGVTLSPHKWSPFRVLFSWAFLAVTAAQLLKPLWPGQEEVNVN